MALWFFMSYAHTHGDETEQKRVRQFFKDVCKEVAAITGDNVDDVGFLDKYNLATGDKWKDELRAAVRNSRVFVSLLNARYFRREYCGREWSLFEQRCGAYVAQGNEDPDLILPVLWQRPAEDEFPGFATDIQYSVGLAGVIEEDVPRVEHVNEHGVRFVIRRRETTHLNAYTTTIEQLAGQIVHRAKAHVLPELSDAKLPAIDAIEPKFPTGHAAAARQPAAPTSFGQAKFAVFAGTAAEMAAIEGADLDAYGTGGEREWTPFHPDNMRRFFLIAQKQSTEMGLACEWLSVNENFVQKLKDAQQNSEIVVMVVDPWTAKVPRFADALSSFDQVLFRNCVVLIPWDTSTLELHDSLRMALDNVLPNRFAVSNKTYLREEIESVNELETQISMAMTDLEEILAASRTPMRAVREGQFNSPPPLASVNQ